MDNLSLLKPEEEAELYQIYKDGGEVPALPVVARLLPTQQQDVVFSHVWSI